MRNLDWCSVGLIFVAIVNNVWGANILILSGLPSPSHSLWFNKLATLLASKGHKITILDSTDKMKSKAQNVEQIVLEGGYNYTSELYDLDILIERGSLKFSVDVVTEYTMVTCRTMLFSKASKEFIERYKKKQKPFDLIIHDGAACESFLGFVHTFGNPPLIEATTYGDPTLLLHYAGQYDNPSYVPLVIFPHHTPMTFYERLQSTLLYMYESYIIYGHHLPEMNKMAKEFFGPDLPPVEEIGKNASLIILNSHFSYSLPKPNFPSVINIGGFHIDPPKPLQKEIKTFLDGAMQGAIYFSFGTNILSSYMDIKRIEMFVEVFRQLPQRVLWKFENDTIPNKPDNLLISKWLPQNDILAHPNIQLFITHGGILSSQEAIYHGVPMIGIPFMIDQFSNTLKLQEKGVAIKLDYSTLTQQNLKESIETILNNKRYEEEVKEWSKVFRDNPLSPQESALFWVEYVLRHPNSKFMKSPTMNIPIYQILLLDVIFVLVSILVIILFMLKVIFKFIFHLYSVFRTLRINTTKKKAQ